MRIAAMEWNVTRTQIFAILIGLSICSAMFSVLRADETNHASVKVVTSCNHPKKDPAEISGDPRGEHVTTAGKKFRNDLPCSPDIFRRYYESHGYFPAGGKWLESKSAGKLPEYITNLCKFQWSQIPEDKLRRCISQSNVRYIVTIGDSNGAKYHSALVKHFTRTASKPGCLVTRREAMEMGGYMPDRKYFARGDTTTLALMENHVRSCHSCSSREITCHFQNEAEKATHEYKSSNADSKNVGDGWRSEHNRGVKRPVSNSQHSKSLFKYNAKSQGKLKSFNVTIEHVAMSQVLDTSLLLRIPLNMTSSGHVTSAGTFQEYIMKYYLSKQVPDILVIFLPFNHAKFDGSIERLNLDISYFASLVDLYIPERTQVFWIPAFREFEGFRKNIPRFESNLLAWEKIDRLNHVMFDVIKRNLVDISTSSRRHGNNTYGFLDLIEVSKNRGKWTFDAMHMLPVWYDLLMSYFLEMLCKL